MAKLTNKDNLEKLAKALDSRAKAAIKESVAEESARAQGTENDLQSQINETVDMFGGKSIRYVTQNEYDQLSEAQKNDPTVIYFVTDAEDLSHAHSNKSILDKFSARTITIGKTGQTFDGSANISWTLSQIGASAEGHTHDDRYYTESEINTKVSNLQAEIDADVKVEADRAKAAEVTLQANIDKKSDNGHTHDDRYFTETEVTNKLAGKSDTGHTHDDRYYTETEVNNLLSGKADNSHGTHVTYATATPKANGTAAVGTSSKVAREDHVHPMQTTISGNAGTADKLKTARNITIGNQTNSFDGSANVSYTLHEIGAAEEHDHPYMPVQVLTSGDLNDIKTTGYYSLKNSLTNAPQTGHAMLFVDFSVGTPFQLFKHDTTFKLWQRTWNSSTSAWGSWTAVMANDISGNAATASAAAKLSTARTLTIGGTGKSFDGSGNVSWSLTEIGAAPADHTHDDRYYTESEINTKISNLQKEIDADVLVETNRAKGVETTLQANIDKKSDIGHNHGDLYYTESEIDNMLTGYSTTDHAHDGRYYTEAEIDSKVTTLNAAINEKADANHGNHVPATQTASNKVFLRNDNTWATITPDNIGAAKSSHGTHVTYATAVPKANGTAAIGSANRVAREDHVHPLQESVAKLTTARTITIGNQGLSFDGSDNITFTLGEIGAAGSGHTHNELYYTESEIDTKVSDLQAEIDEDVKVEADRAKAAENTLQANIDKKANASHGNHVPTTQTANNAVFLRNDNTWATVTPANIGASAEGHTHDGRYYTEAEIDSKITTLNSAIDGKANSSHGNHVPTTETANNARFLRNDNTWQTITPANIGAAKSSHGTHVDYATAIPKENGTGAVGTSSKVAREDHVHPLQTTISGNAGSADTLSAPRTLTIGNTGKEFDGSANVSWTLTEIGAAESGHTHDGRYYTESEINTKITNLQAEIDTDVKVEADRAKAAEAGLQANIDGKANVSHGNHVPATQTASNKVFLRNDNTWATITPANIGASATGHTHDDRYYTEGEIDTKISTLNTNIATAKSDAQAYADTKIAALVDSAPDALNTLNELATAITDHKDVYDAYVTEIDAKLAGKSDTDHTHKYAGSSSVGGAATSANKVNKNLIVKLNSGTTEGTNLFTFNGSAAKTIDITPANIGAAASSHGTHVTYSTATPKANGTAAVGSSGDVARADHVHPLQTTISGNAGTADKLSAGRSITIGNKSNTFDGSANISYSLAEIGASAEGHTHNYAGSSSAGGAANSVKTNLIIKLNSGTTEGTNLFTFNGSTAKTINITPSSIGAAASSHGTHVTYATATPIVAGTGAVGSSSKVAREDHVHPAQTSVTGNAGTATKLATARTITVNGVVSGSTSFDGSQNVTITTVANDITEITKSLTVGTDWMNTGITGDNLSTGTYVVQMYADTQGTGGLWREYFSGIMSWVADGTNSSEADEIALHKAGHAPNNQHIYLRTKRNTNGSLVLQIAAKTAITAEISFKFKFKKLI